MIFDGPVGVVDIDFNDVYMGRTTAATTIEDDKDWLDVMYQQEGTKPDDKVETGIIKKVVATFGEITTARLASLVNGVSVTAGGTIKFGKNSYTGLKASIGKKLTLTRVDSNGIKSTDDKDVIIMYIAIPEITGPINWDASAQIGLPVTFHCFPHEYTNSISGNVEKSFGYMGIASSAGIPNAA